MPEEQVYQNGTEVFILKYVAGKKRQDLKKYIKGTIVDSELSGNVALYGNPFNVTNYKVLGEDGVYYLGNMGNRVLYDQYFMTRDMYKNALMSMMQSKQEEKVAMIQSIDQDIKSLSEILEKLTSEKKQQEPEVPKQYSKSNGIPVFFLQK